MSGVGRELSSLLLMPIVEVDLTTKDIGLVSAREFGATALHGPIPWPVIGDRHRAKRARRECNSPLDWPVYGATPGQVMGHSAQRNGRTALIKSVLLAHRVDELGKAALRKQLRRAQMVEFFAKVPPCLIGMEACSSAHHWARVLLADLWTRGGLWTWGFMPACRCLLHEESDHAFLEIFPDLRPTL
jgi:hypothetical protein